MTEKAGDRIGRYRLLQEIGHGGCGVVYMAEQEAPVRRKVALKVIKLGMDTRQVVARFEAERQALALMDHPNIARVLDAGATDAGRPFFVMELVGGIKITDYCDQHQLTTRQRLDLFIQVCRAIQHAHQKGVIHRDIKPSNVLVATQDGAAVPKVIDFGIAKATQGRLTDQTLFTAFEQFLGTPAYMSPEQAQLGGLDVDTRSDIYSLGVLLYELLTGTTPFDTKTLLAAGLDEMRRTIRDVEPVKPSTRLTQESVAADARRRKPPATGHGATDDDVRASARRLLHEVRGDLDWIVMKCLEKDRTRRYETANGLARDLERHLNQEPVVARPPSAIYRLHKFIRRNRLVAASATAVATVLILGVAVSAWQAAHARRAVREQDRLRQQAEQATQRTQEALSQMESIQLHRAEEYMADQRRLEALPRWALVLRNNPSNRIAAERLMSTLSHRTWARLACPPMEHSNRVTMAMFSADGKRVVTSGADNTAWVWDAATGQRLAGPFSHAAEINTAAFSRDGRMVVTASKDKTARIWNAETGAPVTEPLPYDDDVYTAQFSPDGRLVLATGGHVGQLWDVRTGQREGAALRAAGFVSDARFSPDGSRVAMACRGRQAQVWDVASGVCQHRFEHSTNVWSVAFSPDGKWVATASDDRTARVWDVQTGQPVGEPLQHLARVWGAEFSPDGQRIVTACGDHTAQIWDVRTGRRIGPALKHDGGVRSAMFSLEGLRVVTASHDKTARVWDALTGEALTEPMAHESGVFVAQFSPDGQRVLIASNGKAVMIWDISPAPVLSLHLNSSEAWSAAFSPDGRRVVVGTQSGTTCVWDALTGNPLTVLQHERRSAKDPVNWVEFSPDGRSVAVGSHHGWAGVWNSSTGKLLGLARAPSAGLGEIGSARFSHDGRSFVTASGDGTARVWDAQTGEPLSELLLHDAGIMHVEFSPDDKWVLTSRLARLWDVRTSQVVREFPHEANVNSAHFSPDGRRVLTASSDYSARVWEAQTGALLGTLLHAAEVFSARFSPDGQLIVTAHRGEYSLRVWDAVTFRPLTETFGDGQTPEFAPDSQRLIDGAVHRGSGVCIWDARTGLRLSERFLQGGYCRFSHFSPDGRRVLLATDKDVQIRAAPPAPLPVPAWLPELAEALAGQRFNAEGLLEPVCAAALWAVQQRMAAWANEEPTRPRMSVGAPSRRSAATSPTPAPEESRASEPTVGVPSAAREPRALPDEFYARWARWFLADAFTRTVLPASPLTLPQYVESLLEQGTPEDCREALLMQPTNAVALALVGRDLTNEALADWMTRRAVELAPERFQTWSGRIPVLVKAGRLDEAIVAMARAITLYGNSPTYWLTYGGMLEQADRLEEALAAFGKAIEFARIRTSEADQGKAALSRRSALLRRLGRPAEAQADFLAANGIPPRPGDAGKSAVDLSAHYNVGLDAKPEWDGVPRGMQTLAGVRFDIRGWVQLLRVPSSQSAAPVKGIRVSQKCHRLHFLQGCGPPLPDGTVVARYVIYFADGEQVELPVVYGEDVRDRVVASDPVPATSRAVCVWPGPDNHPARRLYCRTWQNPRPDTEVTTIDFLPEDVRSEPFLVALTAEP